MIILLRQSIAVIEINRDHHAPHWSAYVFWLSRLRPLRRQQSYIIALFRARSARAMLPLIAALPLCVVASLRLLRDCHTCHRLAGEPAHPTPQKDMSQTRPAKLAIRLMFLVPSCFLAQERSSFWLKLPVDC